MSHGRLDRLLAARNSWPRWVNGCIDAVADSPMSLLGRIAALRYRPRGPLPAVSRVRRSPITVAIGPVNYSNQGTLWAQALVESFPHVSTSTFAVDVPGGFHFPSDLIVPVDFYQKSRKWQQAQADSLGSFSHVLVEAEEPLFGRYMGRSPQKERLFLHERGVSVAYMAHGTDIRIPSLHRQRTEWSPFADSTMYLEGLEKRARKNLDFLTSIDNEVFVSTPDLLLDLPTATWCPVVVDVDAWALKEPAPKTRRPLRVVHAPSVQTMKGTQLIDPVLRDLDAVGVIEYRPLQGIPSQLMPREISWADVVLDQFRLGSYGVAACEAMAAGKVVVGHVIPDVRHIVQEKTGMSLPVVEATPQSLSDVLVELAQNAQQVTSLQMSSREFVERIHSGPRSAEILMTHWVNKGATAGPEKEG